MHCEFNREATFACKRKFVANVSLLDVDLVHHKSGGRFKPFAVCKCLLLLKASLNELVSSSVHHLILSDVFVFNSLQHQKKIGWHKFIIAVNTQPGTCKAYAAHLVL